MANRFEKYDVKFEEFNRSFESPIKYGSDGYTVPTSLISLYDRDIGDEASRTIIPFKPYQKRGYASNASDLVSSSTFTQGNDPIRDAIIEQQEISLSEKPLPIKKGCLDPKARNYDRTATVNDPSSCEYSSTNNVSTGGDTIKPLSESPDVTIYFTADVKDVELLENGKETKKYLPAALKYKAKELLIPKTFTARRTNLKTNDSYKIYSILSKTKVDIKPIVLPDFLPDVTMSERREIEIGRDVPLGFSTVKPINDSSLLNYGSITFNTYEVIFEKNGTQIPYIKNDILNSISLNIEFDMEPEIIIPDEPIIGVSIVSDLSKDGDVQIISSWGDKIVLEEDGEEFLQYRPSVKGEVPYIDIRGINIGKDSHDMAIQIQTPNNNEVTVIRNFEHRIELVSGETKIKVITTKDIVDPPADKPKLNVKIKNLEYNILSKEPTFIPYQSFNADYINFRLGKTEKRIQPNGTLTLDVKDFLNGIGQYTLYLQPVSERAGSGDYEKIIINVISKEYLAGPDIRVINYPSIIKGADFKGFNVPFEISWQSVNTNYIKIYVGPPENNIGLGKFGPTDSVRFIVEDVLKKLKGADYSRDITEIPLSFIPFNEEGNELTKGKVEKANIVFDKGDLTLRRGTVISDIKEAFKQNFDNKIFDENVSNFLTHYVHLGAGKNNLVSTYAIDTENLSEFKFNDTTNQNEKIKEVKALVLKLYEPLPTTVSKNNKVWLSKIQSIPIIDKITILEDFTKDCIPLSPNFSLEVGDDIGYQILDDLVTSGSVTSNEVVNQFISSSDFSLDNLDINFVTSSTVLNEDGTGTYVELTDSHTIDWKSFVKYSSAKERVANFYYKVKLIQSYEGKYNGLVSGSSVDFGSGTTSQITGSVTSSVAVSNEAKRTLGKINEVKKGFDAFEKFLYTSSSVGDITYPGAGGNSLSASNSSDVLSWYDTTYTSAAEYDLNNPSRFVNNLPQHIQDDQNGSDFVLFFDMIGQHFDIIYSHIKASSQSKKLENKFERGINTDLIYHMLESLGFDADSGVKSQLLWEYAFGKHSDGTQVSEMSGKDRQQEIWRRILNNLPYLNKHKGTKRALHAAMSCYGVPASLLTISEFGGPSDNSTEATSQFTYSDRTAAINISGSSSIIIPWKESKSTYPNTVEIRLNTEQKQDQQILSGSNWSLDILKDTGSLGKIQLTVGAESASTSTLPLFNDEYTQVVVTRESGSGSDIFSIYAKEGFQGRIRNESSTTLTTTTKAWDSGSEIQIGGNTLTASIDEFRLWTSPISESVINNHTLLPDAIDGNHISSSTDDLILRLDFEYPKDRSSDTEIKNVAVINTYEPFVTASLFPNISEYPYQYTTYDRDVTANVPSSGFNFGNKIRFETQTLVSDLNYKSRATKKSYDQASIDSNKLGLFFSPIKEINMDIMKSLGGFNIDDYIGDPRDDYKESYTKLKDLRNYYFDRYSLNLHEYIQLVRYIDKSLFGVLESLVPARAKVASGLLIEPHILERSKLELKPTTASLDSYISNIDTQEDIIVTSSIKNILGVVSSSDDIFISGSQLNLLGEITASDTTITSGSYNTFDGEITASDNINQYGFITVNSGSDMGGISFIVNAEFEQSASGEFDYESAYQQIGMDPNSLTVAGFGLYGSGSHTIITKLDKNNNFVRERAKVFLIKESYTVNVPKLLNSASLYTELETVTKFRHKVNILPFTGSNGLESSDPTVSGNVVEVRPLNGTYGTHYVNVGDLTSGLENSFFNGSKQTSATTIDGGSPVVTFTTNPNTLRVSDSGRGSGEPILQVD